LYNDAGEAYTAILDLSTPPKAYNLWGLQAGVDIYKNFSVGLTVNNLLNTNIKIISTDCVSLVMKLGAILS
jgi:iron complex outermembrane receptor protein